MQLPEKHSKRTKRLLKEVPKKNIAIWLLKEGYYPEQYVVPPCFSVSRFDLKSIPYFNVNSSSNQQKFEPTKSELINVSFPKSQLTDRTFGIINPKIYHDIVWYLMEEWSFVIEHLFNSDNKIYSYSFPIPVSKKNKGNLENLRAGRMIYEYIEMAENDLVAEAYNYKFILKTDIKNFYPSIYTHSIAWALHTKRIIRQSGNRCDFSGFLGLKLDKLFQNANDGCTNGIAIGPAVSDLISEIILSGIDKESTIEIVNKNIDFIAVRFKDDYRFLCQSKEDASFIIKTLQRNLSEYNLMLNEDKSLVKELPEGLFRDWTSDYQQFSLRSKNKIKYKRFEKSLLGTLKVDKENKGTGVVDRFLSELTNNENDLKIDFGNKNFMKAISLLLLLKERRNKSFPQVLAIIEKIVEEKSSNIKLIEKIENAIEKLFNEKISNIKENEYDLIWLMYFIKSNDLINITFPSKVQSKLINSLKINRQCFFKPIESDFNIFQSIKGKGRNKTLLEHLSLFKKNKDE